MYLGRNKFLKLVVLKKSLEIFTFLSRLLKIIDVFFILASFSEKDIKMKPSELNCDNENLAKELLQILNSTEVTEQVDDPGEGCSKDDPVSDIGLRRRALKHRSVEEKIKKPRT